MKKVGWMGVGSFVLTFFALSSSANMAKYDGYFVTQDEAISRGGVGGYVPIPSMREQQERERAGIAAHEKDSKDAYSNRAAVAKEPVAAKTSPETLLFALGDASLKGQDLSKLDSMASQAKDSGSKVKIEGYADALGTPEANMKLSQSRAQAVEKYLEGKGVSSDKMDISCYGEQKAKPVGGLQGNPEDRKVVIAVG